MRNKTFIFSIFTVIGLLMLTGAVYAQELLNEVVVNPTDGGIGSLEVFGLTGGVAIAINFIMSALKKYAKLPVAWCPFVAFILGALSGIGVFFSGIAPAGMTMIQCIIAGITLGGTATGLYDMKKKVDVALYGTK